MEKKLTILQKDSQFDANNNNHPSHYENKPIQVSENFTTKKLKIFR